MNVSILFQDENIVAVTKPSGLLVHRSTESSDRTFLLQELRDQIGKKIFPVHRLDRAASGSIVFAFSGESAATLQKALSENDTVKEYLAFVHGQPAESGEIDYPLTDERGVKKECRTHFERIATTEVGSLMRIRIETGRRHQIRRHFSHFRHHLLGDTRYGKARINHPARDRYGLTRLFLHCSRISVRHPIHGGRLEFKSPLPPELQTFLARIPLEVPHAKNG